MDDFGYGSRGETHTGVRRAVVDGKCGVVRHGAIEFDLIWDTLGGENYIRHLTDEFVSLTGFQQVVSGAGNDLSGIVDIEKRGFGLIDVRG